MITRKNLSTLALLAAFTTASANAATINSTSADGEVNSDSTLGNNTNDQSSIGRWTASPDFVTVLPFELPTLNPGESFDAAELSLTLRAKFNSGSFAPSGTSSIGFNIDLVGLDRVAASDTLLGTDYAASGTVLEDPFVFDSDTIGATYSSDITSWLNTQYDNGNNAGEFVFLRVQSDLDDPGALSDQTIYQFFTSENGTDTPEISYEVVPEPSSLMLGLGLGGLLVARRRRG